MSKLVLDEGDIQEAVKFWLEKCHPNLAGEYSLCFRARMNRFKKDDADFTIELEFKPEEKY